MTTNRAAEWLMIAAISAVLTAVFLPRASIQRASVEPLNAVKDAPDTARTSADEDDVDALMRLTMGAAAQDGQDDPSPSNHEPKRNRIRPDGPDRPDRPRDESADDDGERGFRAQGVRIGPAMIDGCIEVIRDIDPEMAKRMKSLRTENPQEFEAKLRPVGRRLLALVQLKQRDPDLYKAKIDEMHQEMQVRRMGEDLREAINAGDLEKAARIESQLRGMLKLQIVLQVKSRSELACSLEKQATALKEEIARDVEAIDETVEARLEAIKSGPGPGSSPMDVIPMDEPPRRPGPDVGGPGAKRS